MATQYSILSVLIGPEIQEKISLGLFFFDLEEIYFSYSRNKLSAAKTLLSNSAFKILKDTLENIEKKIDSDNTNYLERWGFRIFKNKTFDHTFSGSYISYLSRYSNNVLTFTNPKEIYLDTNSENFKSLFRKFVDNTVDFTEPTHKVNPFEYIRTQYGSKILKHYDINKEITPDEVPNLIVSVRVDFTGRNEIDVFAQTVDMEASPYTVTSHINSFIQLKSTYNENKVRMKDFIIAKEPLKDKFPKQHDVWKQLKSSSVLNYLDLSESEKIIEYAENHDVIPLSKVED